MTQPNKPGWIGSAGRQAALPGPLRELHRAVLRRFLETGAPPAVDWIAGAAAGLGLSDAAVTELAAADLVHAANGVVAVAYPFAGTPTRQQVELDGFPAVFAMCAIDALGIPAMAGRDGRITAIDPRDGAPVVVSVRGGQWRWTPVTAVVVFGSGRTVHDALRAAVPGPAPGRNRAAHRRPQPLSAGGWDQAPGS
jgi:hypothetical protein